MAEVEVTTLVVVELGLITVADRVPEGVAGSPSCGRERGRSTGPVSGSASLDMIPASDVRTFGDLVE